MDSFEEITVEFANQKEEELYAFAMMGERARDFFSSDIGRYIVGCAAQEIDAIKDELLKTPVWRKAKIKSLQAKAEAAKLSIQWLREAINMGDHAHEALKQMRDQ